VAKNPLFFLIKRDKKFNNIYKLAKKSGKVGRGENFGKEIADR
jgi:hypothetical protein